MRTGRPKAELVVSAEERTTLEGWMRRRTSAPALALRAGIVLDCAGGLNNTAVARRRRVSKQIVGKWRERFVRHRVAGLLDEPRCGTPRKIEDGQVESVIVRTLESKPRDATHWSTRSMAETSGLSHMTIQRIWRAFGLEPHRTETFKLSTDPQFVEKVRDIVGLYLDPPERALVLQPDAISAGSRANKATASQNGNPSHFDRLEWKRGRQAQPADSRRSQNSLKAKSLSA